MNKIKQFAKILVDYSINVKKGEYVMVDSSFLAKDLLLEVYKRIIQKGAYPLMSTGIPGTARIYYENASEQQLKHFPKLTWHKVKNSQAEIGIGAPKDTKELRHINPKKIALRQKTIFPISDYIVNEKKKIRRVTTQFPTPALAKDANMSLRKYKKWFFRAVNQNWPKEAERLKKIHSLFKNANIIQIKAPGTNLKLSVKNRPLIVDDGHENMPGGEMFYAPIRKSVNGCIKFTYPAIRAGNEVRGIKLTFKNGKVIKATAAKNQKFLKEMINMDKGSKYVGELGIGCNPKIDKFTKNLLFDEKIFPSIHLALGMAYKECKGKNKSALHWDIVCDMKKGEIIVNNKTVQKNGKWIF